MLVDEFVQGRMPATLVCQLAYWAMRSGMAGSVRDLAAAPGQSSGNYSKHLDKALGFTAAQESHYHLE
eukprot:7076422-Alexandrium_andersonii.AAC.1